METEVVNSAAESQRNQRKKDGGMQGLLYGIEDSPPWYMTFLVGFQHYLLMFGGTITTPLIVTPAMCIGDDDAGKSEVISTVFFVDGISTLLQCTFGTRLPIVQGGSFSFLPPIFAVLALPEWQCPDPPDEGNLTMLNQTMFEWRRGVWTSRMREIQGSLALSSIFQILLGATGVISLLLPYVGPLTIAPVLSLIGLSLYSAAADYCAYHWGIAIFTMFLITLFSQYLRNIFPPLPGYSKERGFHKVRYPLFSLFPVIFSIAIAWLFCMILTVAGAFTDDPNGYGYRARTDTKLKVLDDANWFRFPYPGQWGMPTYSPAAVIGLIAGMSAAIMESIGDYYACAQISGAPTPPVHAINRGVMFEGIGIACAGVWGGTSGVTSYSHNIGAIGITKVASRRVIQVGAIITIILALFGKFGALFVTLPDPIYGGIFMTLFGLVMAIGVSSLQFCDLNSSRNLYIFGFSVLLGLSVPGWIGSHPEAIDTGNSTLDQVLFVLLNTPMVIAGTVGFVLDNTVSGTPEERGISQWKPKNNIDTSTDTKSPYDLPFGMSYLRKWKWTRYVPFLPTYKAPTFSCCSLKQCLCCHPTTGEKTKNDTVNHNNVTEGYDNPSMAHSGV